MMSPHLAKVLAAIGFAVLISKLSSLVAVLADTLVSRKTLKTYGADKPARAWAIVTGSTAGIGEEFALQLAEAGFNIGLIGRNQVKLNDVAARVKAHNVEAASFVLDAAAPSENVYQYLEKWTRDLGNVAILVNNVGVSHEMPVSFMETDDKEMVEIINVNNLATLQITKAILPTIKQFASVKSNGRGLVLTMGSFAGLTPSPLLATYAGSKAFLQAWNSALATELKPFNIDAQLIVSYMVVSAMSKIRRPNATTPTAKQFVASALSGIGRRGGAQERPNTMTPYWSHALIHWGANQLGVYSSLIASFTYNMHQGIRKRALKKKEREATNASS